MSNTFSWDINSLETFPTQSGHENVVYVVHWHLYGTDQTQTYRAERYGMTQVAPYVSGSPFIPFNELTQEEVSSWVIDAMGTQSYYELTGSIDQRLYELANPPTVTLTPPWAISTGSLEEVRQIHFSQHFVGESSVELIVKLAVVISQL